VELLYFMVICTRFAPATLAPFPRSWLLGETSWLWVSVFTRHLLLGFTFVPVRGQALPVAAWASTNLWDWAPRGCSPGRWLRNACVSDEHSGHRQLVGVSVTPK